MSLADRPVRSVLASPSSSQICAAWAVTLASFRARDQRIRPALALSLTVSAASAPPRERRRRRSACTISLGLRLRLLFRALSVVESRKALQRVHPLGDLLLRSLFDALASGRDDVREVGLNRRTFRGSADFDSGARPCIRSRQVETRPPGAGDEAGNRPAGSGAGGLTAQTGGPMYCSGLIETVRAATVAQITRPHGERIDLHLPALI